MNIKDYYFHTISKDKKDNVIYNHFECIIKDGKLKSQKLLNNNEMKFNGLEYISVAEYIEPSLYKTFIIDKDNYNKSELSKIFISYQDYLEYLKSNEWLELPLSKEEFFKKYNTNEKRDYYNYLDSISRTYPVDIEYLYKLTGDIIYKYILEMIDSTILYCNKSEYCFNQYIRNSTGITFIFPKNLDIVNVNIIPNLPFNIESKLVKTLQNLSNRYSNQIGEVQVKGYIEVNKAIGLLIDDNINKEQILNILNKYNLNLMLYKLKNDEIIEI